MRLTYSMRAANGTWTAAESLDPGHDAGGLVVAVDPADGLHALWKRQDGGDTRLVYRYRPANGAGQAAVPLLNTGNLIAPAYLGSDSRGNLFAVGWEQHNTWEAYVIGKLTGGAWGGAEKIYNRLQIQVNPVAADIGPDDRLTILGSASLSADDAETVLLTRTSTGQWGIETGLPFEVYEYVYYFDLSRDGATYVIDSDQMGGPTNLYRRSPAGDWSEGLPLPINPYLVDGAVDGTGRLHLLGGEGSYVTWTPGSGWQSPTPVVTNAVPASEL